MRIIVALYALFALSSFHSPAAAKEADRTGTFTESCLPTVNCSATITKTGKGKWKMVWVAMDRTGTRTYCQHTVLLKPGTGFTASDPAIPDVLVGKLKDGSRLMVDSAAGDGTAYLYLDGMPCEGVKLPAGEKGMIGFNGIYNLEGDY